ncbi:amidohydrolase [Marivirga arenosa]|uniref:Omega-amidase YafV n=1 Tax=Marivirga arenosa TaxID=3059076 RepID=A0AA52F0L9_9BACT|nr:MULTISPECIES: amidohydrolase [unclassified Marivirga]WKK87206.2 amidohydrolase [Marivirga sp. ABR2-2]WNB18323.1 amidohydrolase [Marivirga sp. BKB1-2]
MQDLKVTLIQTPLYWQEKQANLSMFEEKLWEIEEETDLIILPEMFNTGFSMEAEKMAEPMNLHTFKWMKQMASQKKAVITGSFIVNDNGDYFNRLIWMKPDGDYSVYDKRHLFRMANEDEHYTPGEKELIVELKGWKIKPLVCYDLRFPVWCRNKSNNENELAYDIILFVANWPAVRVNAWDSLLTARAIENVSYSIGVNRIGNDGNEIPHNGHSAIYDPKGNAVYFADDREVIKTISLSAEELMKFRQKFPAQLDADNFLIN